MKIVYQKLKTKLRPILKVEDNENLKYKLETLCWKHLGMGLLKETDKDNEYVYKSVIIFQNPVYFIVKEAK